MGSRRGKGGAQVQGHARQGISLLKGSWKREKWRVRKESNVRV
jgi:hypothetical protein